MVADRPIHIGTFTDSRRLTNDLYLYKTVQESLNSEELLKTVPETFTLNSDRVTSAELRGDINQNLRVYVSPPLTDTEENIVAGGTNGNNELEIPSGTILAGLTNTTVPIGGAAGTSFTLRLTEDQSTTVATFLADPNNDVLNNDLEFNYDTVVPDLNIASIEGDSINQTIKLVYERLLTDNETIFDETIGKANRLFVPCLLYTSPSPRDRQKSRMPSSA